MDINDLFRGYHPNPSSLPDPWEFQELVDKRVDWLIKRAERRSVVLKPRHVKRLKKATWDVLWDKYELYRLGFNGMFKYIYAPKMTDLIPGGVGILGKIAKEPASGYVPVAFGFEGKVESTGKTLEEECEFE